MKKLYLLLFCASSAFAQGYTVNIETHVFSLFFEQGVALNNTQKQAIRDDFQVVLSRFAVSNYVVQPFTPENQGVNPYAGHFSFRHAPAITPWHSGSLLYTVRNETNCLVVDKEICGLYTNAFIFTNRHAAQVQLLPDFINRYNRSYTNQNMTDEQKLSFLWNPREIQKLSGQEKQDVLSNYLPSNSTHIVLSQPSMLEYGMTDEFARYSPTNGTWLYCKVRCKYTVREAREYVLSDSWFCVFADNAWHLFVLGDTE